MLAGSGSSLQASWQRLLCTCQLAASPLCMLACKLLIFWGSSVCQGFRSLATITKRCCHDRFGASMNHQTFSKTLSGDPSQDMKQFDMPSMAKAMVPTVQRAALASTLHRISQHFKHHNKINRINHRPRSQWMPYHKAHSAPNLTLKVCCN